VTPSRPNFTKIPPQTGGSSSILIEISPQTPFFDKNLEQDIIKKHFVRNRSKIKNNFH
jgi:hypothetical protein